MTYMQERGVWLLALSYLFTIAGAPADQRTVRPN